MNNIFRIKKEERLFALITLIVIIAFNVLMITYHFDDFGKPKAGFWTLFTKNFQISGFDPYTYLTLSKWKVYYTEYRHPILPFFLYPFSLLNGWLIELTSRNWATIIVAVRGAMPFWQGRRANQAVRRNDKRGEVPGLVYAA